MTRRLRTLPLTAAVVVAGVLSPLAVQAQSVAARFTISTVKDSTIVFVIGEQRWVKVGMEGRAVDPARSDEMIAQFRVLMVEGGEAEALITGQTRRLIDAHVAVIDRPPRPFWRQAMFWVGSLTGLIVGAAASAALL